MKGIAKITIALLTVISAQTVEIVADSGSIAVEMNDSDAVYPVRIDLTLSTNAAWTWMKGATNINQNGTYGTQGVPAAANTPGARYTAASWTGAGGALWLFGGEGYPASGTNGLTTYGDTTWPQRTGLE